MIFGLTHSSANYYVVGLKELCNKLLKTEYRQFNRSTFRRGGRVCFVYPSVSIVTFHIRSVNTYSVLILRIFTVYPSSLPVFCYSPAPGKEKKRRGRSRSGHTTRSDTTQDDAPV